VRDGDDFSFLKNGHVKFRGCFGLVIEPEERSDFLHGMVETDIE
jgi:hypothetical protein